MWILQLGASADLGHDLLVKDCIVKGTAKNFVSEFLGLEHVQHYSLFHKSRWNSENGSYSVIKSFHTAEETDGAENTRNCRCHIFDRIVFKMRISDSEPEKSNVVKYMEISYFQIDYYRIYW